MGYLVVVVYRGGGYRVVGIPCTVDPVTDQASAAPHLKVLRWPGPSLGLRSCSASATRTDPAEVTQRVTVAAEGQSVPPGLVYWHRRRRPSVGPASWPWASLQAGSAVITREVTAVSGMMFAAVLSLVNFIHNYGFNLT